MQILRILMVFAIVTLGITEQLKDVRRELIGEIEIEGKEFKGLTRIQAKEVIKIWRVIGDYEIVIWDGRNKWVEDNSLENFLNKSTEKGNK